MHVVHITIYITIRIMLLNVITAEYTTGCLDKYICLKSEVNLFDRQFIKTLSTDKLRLDIKKMMLVHMSICWSICPYVGPYIF